MELDTAIDQMFTCATAHICPREEACFTVVRWAFEKRKKALSAIPPPPPKTDADEVGYYAPHFPPQVAWEWAREMTAVDWSAA